jgi:hypothetical protein
MRIATLTNKARYLSTLWYLHKHQYIQSSKTGESSATNAFSCPTATAVTLSTSRGLAEYALFRTCATSKRTSYLDIRPLIATCLLSNQRPTKQVRVTTCTQTPLTCTKQFQKNKNGLYYRSPLHHYRQSPARLRLSHGTGSFTSR